MASSSNEETKYDLTSILCHPNRDYLIRNNGDQVKVDTLKGKMVWLYFSASWCGPCQNFTPKLVEVYNQLLLQDNEIEVVFISGDEDNESFDGYFSKMPWLAVPFSDSETLEALNELFSVDGIPHLVFLEENGELSTADGVMVIDEYGVEAYPFSSERMEKLKELEIEAKKNQSLKSLLEIKSRDYVIAADGKKIPVSELDGKIVGLYFIETSYQRCVDFNTKLVEVYKSLRENGVNNFEIVMVPLDQDEPLFGQVFQGLPWFSLPVNDRLCLKLIQYFELEGLPTVVIIGPDGKTLRSNAADAIEEHGGRVYPFTPDKFAELEEVERAKQEAQTLESILVLGDRDFVIRKDDLQVPVSDLIGKNILFYFSAHWCPPCRNFLPKLIKAYEEIKKDNNSLEIIFISSDKDETSFNEYFSEMPWLALPFGDKREKSLSRLFKVRGIPTAVAIGPDGKTVSTEACQLIMCHGAKAYPFTGERVEEVEREYKKMAEGWPGKVERKEVHDHELVLTERLSFFCDECDEAGRVLSYYCGDCDFDLHPECALEGGGRGGNGGDDEEEKTGEGFVCDGDKCFKA